MSPHPRRHARAATVRLVTSMLLALGLARAAPAGAQTRSATNEVEPLTIVAPRDPAIVSTYPAAGQAVAPGLLIVKVSFDIAMAPDRWSYARSGAANYPQCLETPRLLADAKTFVLLCSVAPSSAYAIELNPEPARGFTGLGGRRAPHLALRFTTSDAASTSSLALAMTAAALLDSDSPLMGADPAAPAKTAALDHATTILPH